MFKLKVTANAGKLHELLTLAKKQSSALKETLAKINEFEFKGSINVPDRSEQSTASKAKADQIKINPLEQNKKEDVYQLIEKFAQREIEETAKAVKEENGVPIQADCHIAKEIKYQTALLQGIKNAIKEAALALEIQNRQSVKTEQSKEILYEKMKCLIKKSFDSSNVKIEVSYIN